MLGSSPSTPLTKTASAEAVAQPTQRGPSKGWYGLALVVLLIGLAAFAASLNVSRAKVTQIEADMQRFVAPGSVTLQFDETGLYHLYYEKIGELDGRTFDTSEKMASMPKLNISLTAADTGEVVPVARASASESHMYGHGRANSEFTFTIPAPGSYELTTSHLNPIDDEILLAVGRPIAVGLMSDWTGPFGGASLLAFAFVFSTILSLVVYTLRSGKVTRRED